MARVWLCRTRLAAFRHCLLYSALLCLHMPGTIATSRLPPPTALWRGLVRGAIVVVVVAIVVSGTRHVSFVSPRVRLFNHFNLEHAHNVKLWGCVLELAKGVTASGPRPRPCPMPIILHLNFIMDPQTRAAPSRVCMCVCVTLLIHKNLISLAVCRPQYTHTNTHTHPLPFPAMIWQNSLLAPHVE